ncbi:MAG: serine/threonine-protein kinase, partial [Acidobacteriota bacterium]
MAKDRPKTPTAHDAPTVKLPDFQPEDGGPTRVLKQPETAAADAPKPSEDKESVGDRVGKILLVDVLGVGGMGRVYSGWDEKLERRVALKSIRRRHSTSEDLKARFLQEAQILSRLQHPNICQIYDYLEGDDADFLVLERIEGSPLSDLDPAELGPETRLRIALEIADVLAVAHEADVVHRDLKPANV